MLFVHRDPGDPISEITLSPETGQLAVHLQKDVLQDVLSAIPLPGAAEGDFEHQPLVPGHQPLKGYR